LDLATTPALRATPPVPGGEPEIRIIFETNLRRGQKLKAAASDIDLRPQLPRELSANFL